MLKKAKNLDFFGERPALRMGGSSTHKTWCGFACSIQVILACIVSGIYYFQQFFDRSTLTYIFTEEYDADEPTSQNLLKSLIISKNTFFLMIAITETATISSPELFASSTPLLSSFPIQFSFKDSTHSMILPAASCDTLSYFQDILSDPEMQTMPNLQVVIQNPSKFLCLEATSINFINQLRTSIEISIGCSVSGCDSLKIRVTTDSGYLLENIHFKDQLAIQSVNYYNIVRDSSTDPQLLLRISPFHKRLTYTRYYPKLLVLVGLIGGILKFLMVLGSFVTKPFSKLSMRTELVNQLFTFEIKSDHRHNKANPVLTIKEPYDLPKDKVYSIHKQSYDPTLKQLPKLDKEENDCIQELDENVQYFNNSNHYQHTNLINSTAYTNGSGLKLISNAPIPSEISIQRPFIKTLHNQELDSVIELEEIGASEMFIPSPMTVPASFSSLCGLTPLSRNSSSVPLEYNRLSKIDQGAKISPQKQVSTNYLLNLSETSKQLKNKQDCFQSEGVLFSGQINTLSGDTSSFDQPENEDPDKPNESENFNHNESCNNTNNANTDQEKNIAKHLSKTDIVCTQSNLQINEKDFFPSFNKLQLMPADNTTTQQSIPNLPFRFRIPSLNQPGTIVPLVKSPFQSDKQPDKKTALTNERDNDDPKIDQNHSDAGSKQNQKGEEPKLDQQKTLLSDKNMKLSQKIKTFFSQKSIDISELMRLNILSKNPQERPSGRVLEDPHSTAAELDAKKIILNWQLSFRKKSTHDQFEDIISGKEKKSIVLKFKDYLNYFLFCLKRTPKVKQMKITNRKVKNRLDLIHILQKLTEIEKLKVLLLSPDQINLFDYMPREFVQRKDPIFEKSSLSDLSSQKNNRFATWSLLCAEKTSLDMYSNACIAFHYIKQKKDKTKLDQKLIGMLDPQIKSYFMETQIQPEQLQNYAYMLGSQSKQRDDTTFFKQINAKGLSDQVQSISNNFPQNSLGKDAGQMIQARYQQSQQDYQQQIASQTKKKSYFGRQNSFHPVDYNHSLPERRQFCSNKPQQQLGQMVESQDGNSEGSLMQSNISHISQITSLHQINDIPDVDRSEISFSAIPYADDEKKEVLKQTNPPPSIFNKNSNNLGSQKNLRESLNHLPLLVNSRNNSKEAKQKKKNFFTFELNHVSVSQNKIETPIILINNMMQQQSQMQSVQNQEIIPAIPLNVQEPFSNSQQDHQLNNNQD